MLHVTVLAVGKLKEAYLREACGEYGKRLGSFCRFQIQEVEEYRLPENPSEAQIELCLEREGRCLEEKIPSQAYVIALCIEGEMPSSPQLAYRLEQLALQGKSHVVFLIGGSYGLCPRLKERAGWELSMSRMTFPHQLARVLLCEQIYRAFSINTNGKYHK